MSCTFNEKAFKLRNLQLILFFHLLHPVNIVRSSRERKSVKAEHGHSDSITRFFFHGCDLVTYHRWLLLSGRSTRQWRRYDSPLCRSGKVTTAKRRELQSGSMSNNGRRFTAVYRRMRAAKMTAREANYFWICAECTIKSSRFPPTRTTA